jgi:hypothetical protein
MMSEPFFFRNKRETGLSDMILIAMTPPEDGSRCSGTVPVKVEQAAIGIKRAISVIIFIELTFFHYILQMM